MNEHIISQTTSDIRAHCVINKLEVSPSSQCQIIKVLRRWYFPNRNCISRIFFLFTDCNFLFKSVKHSIWTCRLVISIIIVDYGKYTWHSQAPDSCSFEKLSDAFDAWFAWAISTVVALSRLGGVLCCWNLLSWKNVLYTTQNMNTETVTLK